MNQEFRTVAPRIESMTAFKLPQVRTVKLNSGIRMMIYDSCTEPVCYLSYLSQGGNLELPRYSYAALISNLRREGTASHSGNDINSILDFNGAWLKTTSHNHHMLTSIRTLNSSLPQVLPVFKEMIFRPTFPDKALSVRREALAKNIEVSMGDVDYLAAFASDALIKGAGHPEAQMENPDAIRRITSADLSKAFASVNGKGTLFLCGNVTPEVEKYVAETFSELPYNLVSPKFNITPYAAAPALSESFVRKADAMQNSVFITLPAPPRNHPDYIPLHIAVTALGGYFGSRLMLNIREKLGLTYGISASLLGSFDGSIIEIQADTDCASTDRLRQEVSAELRGMTVNPPSGAELTRLKQTLLSSQAAILDSPFSIIDYHITAAVTGIPDGYFENKLKAIAGLSPEIIARVAAKYLDPQQIRTAVAGKIN